MSLRKVDFVEGEYYHLYNRGNSKQKIFHDNNDYLRFISMMYACNSEYNFRTFGLIKSEDPYDFERGNQLVHIGVYCLMSNHFHIVVTEKIESGISKFMQKLSTAYVMYYNKKYNRTGGLFEGKFKAQHLNTDKYLKYIFSYIHLNPIKMIQKDWKEIGVLDKKQAIEYLNKYEYSSYLDFIDTKRIQNNILNRESFPGYFPKKNDTIKEIFTWLNYKND